MTKKAIGLLITDIHIQINSKKDNSTDVLNVAHQARDYCEQHKIKKIFLLGDMFKTRDAQNLATLLVFLKFLRILNEFEVYAISGNHDKTDLAALTSYLDVYDGQLNFQLIDHYDVIEVGDIKFHMIPYFPENDVYKKIIDEVNTALDTSEKNVLLSHIAVSGVKNNDGTKVQNNLKLTSFSMFDVVFLGHYHNKSKVGHNIHYIGSTIPHNFGEDNDKGMIVVYDDLSFDTVKIKFTKYISFEFDLGVDETMKEVEYAYEKYKENNNNVRFILRGTRDQLSKFEEKKFKAAGISIKKINVDQEVNITSVQKGEVVVFNNDKILSSFMKYCVANGIKDMKMGKDLLKKGIGHV